MLSYPTMEDMDALWIAEGMNADVDVQIWLPYISLQVKNNIFQLSVLKEG
jgi:hypothetical protein